VVGHQHRDLLAYNIDLAYFKTEEAVNGRLADLERGGFRALEELKASGPSPRRLRLVAWN
jgi:hypothetical protein